MSITCYLDVHGKSIFDFWMYIIKMQPFYSASEQFSV